MNLKNKPLCRRHTFFVFTGSQNLTKMFFSDDLFPAVYSMLLLTYKKKCFILFMILYWKKQEPGGKISVIMTITTALFEENVKEIYEILYFFCYSINFTDLNNDVVQFLYQLFKLQYSWIAALYWFLLYSSGPVVPVYAFLYNVLFLCGLSQDIEHSSLCHAAGPCSLSILCTKAYVC